MVTYENMGFIQNPFRGFAMQRPCFYNINRFIFLYFRHSCYRSLRMLPWKQFFSHLNCYCNTFFVSGEICLATSLLPAQSQQRNKMRLLLQQIPEFSLLDKQTILTQNRSYLVELRFFSLQQQNQLAQRLQNISVPWGLLMRSKVSTGIVKQTCVTQVQAMRPIARALIDAKTLNLS